MSSIPAASAPTPSEPPPPPAMQERWRRLNRRMLLLQPLRELVRTLPLLAGVLVAGSSQGQGGLWSLAGAGVTIVFGVLRWFTTGYRVSGDRLQVRRGVLQRRVVGVPLDRVRTVDIAAPAMHRLFGVVRVTIGTGQSDRKKDDDLRLDGLSAADAAGLRDELLHRRTSISAADAPELELARARASWIVYGPFTLSGVLTVGVVLGFAWRIASEAHLDPARLYAQNGGLADVLQANRWIEFVVLPVAALMAVTGASTIGYALAFWNFRLVRTAGDSLQVTRGLIATRSTTIEERRLRGLEISEPLLLRAARGARCIAIATGLRVGRGAERGGSLLLPPAPREEARRVAAEVLRAREPVTIALARHGPRARRRRYTRLLAVCVPAVAALMLLWRLIGLPAWTWQLSPALLLFGAALAEDRYRSLGHALAGRILVTRWGSLVRRRCALACDGIIGWNLDRSFFQRQAGLATLVATTAAGRQQYRVQDVPLGEALRLADESVPDLLTPFLHP